MTLREKTSQKFKSFFEKVSTMHKGEEFEIAFSEIQRETGSASGTMKRAIKALEEEGWFEVKPGRNSRYARFKLTAPPVMKQPDSEGLQSQSQPEIKIESLTDLREGQLVHHNLHTIEELEQQIENLRRRVRTQEMVIALLQERIAEMEDKLFKK